MLIEPELLAPITALIGGIIAWLLRRLERAESRLEKLNEETLTTLRAQALVAGKVPELTSEVEKLRYESERLRERIRELGGNV